MDKQPEKTLKRPLVLTAAGLGIVQNVAWIGLSITAILLYFVDFVDTTYDRNLGIYIYKLYFDKDTDNTLHGYIIGSKQFNYFMYIYLVLSFAWFVISSVILWVVLKRPEKDKMYDGSIIAWIVIATLTTLLDVILLILLAYDYNLLKSNAGNVLKFQMHIVAIGIVMTLAARGFILWTINVIFIVILSKHRYRRYHEASTRNRPAIDAYSTGSRLPLPWQNEPLEFDNKGYRDDDTLPLPSSQSQFIEDRYDFNRDKPGPNNNRSLPQVNLRMPSSNDNYWNNENQNRNAGNRMQPHTYNEPDSISPYGQQPPRTAKIGRQGGQRSPPLNVPSPYIPDPDYSPPGSPRIRGVLRPKSNYMMY